MEQSVRMSHTIGGVNNHNNTHMSSPGRPAQLGGPPRNHVGKIQVGRLPSVPSPGLVIPEDKIDDYVYAQLSKYGGHRYDHILDDSKKSHFIDLTAKQRQFDMKQQEILASCKMSSVGSFRGDHGLARPSSSSSFRLHAAPLTPLRTVVSDVLNEAGYESPSVSKTMDSLPNIRTPNKDIYILQELVKEEERQRNAISTFAQYGHTSTKGGSPMRTSSRGNFSSTHLLDLATAGNIAAFAMSVATTPANMAVPFSPASFKGQGRQSTKSTKTATSELTMTSLLSTEDESSFINEIVEDVDFGDDDDNEEYGASNVGLVNVVVDDFGMLKDIILQSTIPKQRPLSATSYLPVSSSKYESLKSRSRLYKRQTNQRSLLLDAIGYEDEDEFHETLEADSRIANFATERKTNMVTRRRKTHRHTQHKVNQIVDEREHLSLEVRHSGRHKYIPITDFTHKTPAETETMKEAHRLERECLMEIFVHNNGKNWTRKDHWCSNEPIFTWFGVVVNSAGFVVELQLACNNLRGTLSLESRFSEVVCLTLLSYGDP
jgi:hypothetical protein